MAEDTIETTNASAFEDEKTIVLRKPVELGGITYDHLDLREPTAKELADASKAGNDVEQAISLISRITQVPRGAIEKLRQRDLKEASDFFARFNDDSPKTGGTSLQS